MLIGWTRIVTLLVCVLTTAPLVSQTQNPNRAPTAGAYPASAQYPAGRQNPTGQTPAAQNRTGQSAYQPRLTPQQQSAQQRAAQQSHGEQRQIKSTPIALTGQSIETRPQPIIQPPGFPLSAVDEKRVNEILDYWEYSSLKVEKYKCKFRRFEYDTLICAYRDPQTRVLAAHSVSAGEIRFASPDRARFETARISDFRAPPQKPGGLATYEERVNENKDVFERWVCDGETVYDFDFKQKRMYETEIPKNLQGNVANSPLPFVFGANKKQILERYWVREVTPAGVENEYWLEIHPKRIEDSRIYSRIEVIIAKEDFLPKAMHLYSSQYDPAKGNFASRYFLFENRQVNRQLDTLNDWLGSFIKPRLPLFGGWKKVSGKMGQKQAAVPPTMQSPGKQTTTRHQ